MNETFLFSVLPVDNNTVPLIGRDVEINQIKNAILKFQNISIVGEKQIGKTSLLKSIETEIRKNIQFENVIPIYIDLEKFNYNLETEKLLFLIIDMIFQENRKIEDKFEKSDLDRRYLFSKIVSYCSREKLKILLLLDNFDSITVLDNLTEDFFTFLRGNAIEIGLSIITASRSKLETLCHKGQIAGSQFWNIFNPIINLSIYEDVEHAKNLLERGINSIKIQDLIVSLVGIHPCFLKVAANTVIENGLSNSDNKTEISSKVYEKVKPYYEKRLKLLQNDENNIDNGVHYKFEYISLLNSICSSKISDTTERKEISNLKQLGYIHTNSNGILEISSPLFARYLKEISEACKKPVASYIGEEPYIFISYAHDDNEIVLDILQKLMENKFRFWFDEGINHGNEWRKEITDALDRSRLVIVFISPSSMLSDYVKKEINRAIKKNVKILPIYLTKTELPNEIEFEIDHLHHLKKYKDEDNFMKYLLGDLDDSFKDNIL